MVVVMVVVMVVLVMVLKLPFVSVHGPAVQSSVAQGVRASMDQLAELYCTSHQARHGRQQGLGQVVCLCVKSRGWSQQASTNAGV